MESTCIRIHMGLPSRARLPSSIRILLMTDETPQGERGREGSRRARRARRRRRRDKKALAKLGLQGYFSPSLPPSLSLSLSQVSTQFLFSFGSALVCLLSGAAAAAGQEARGPDFLQHGKKSDSGPEEGGRVTQTAEIIPNSLFRLQWSWG